MYAFWTEALRRGRWVAFIGLAILMGSNGEPLFGRQPVADVVWQTASPAARQALVTGVADTGTVVMRFDKSAFDAFMNAAPSEAAMRPGARLVMSLPLPDGTLSRFNIAESPIIDPALAAAYPEIRTFTGQGIDDPSATTRFGWTAAGFHAVVVAASGTTYIDPVTPDNQELYLVAAKSSRRQPENPFVCVLNGTAEEVANRSFGDFPITNGTSLRTYRLAMAATAEYTAAAGGVNGAVSRIVATMNRVNGIFERELAVRMTVVTGTSASPTALIYQNSATDPYTNSDANAMLDQNQVAVDSVMGSSGYDLGHVFSTFEGGSAVVRSPCNGSTKAKANTGSMSPTGDVFDVDYVAHEIAHQFGASHTFNSNISSCAGANRAGAHAYEIGSGSTIMAYAGICAPENLQPHNNDYFHVDSLDEMTAFITNASTGGSCGTASATNNTLPTVSTAAAFIIPARTPFTLNASGADANGDTLTYAWEEFDLGPASTSVASATTDDGERPLFRSYPPSTSTSRTFPSLTYILNNANVPPPTYACTGGTCLTGEVPPTANRAMNFRVTVRDNRAGGGGINTAATALTVTNVAGPFQVTSPDAALSLTGGAAHTVTWNVANTSAAPVSTASVRILLSTDGGTSFGTELLASTPNDGSQSVTLPNLTTTTARVKVEAVANVFFDVSNANFSITANSVNSVPGPPTGVSGVAGNGQVSVSFTPPSNNGGAAITSYTATASPGGATATGSGSPLVVSGLTNGTPYTFSVTATNSFGTSAPSAASSAVTPTGSTPGPTSLTAAPAPLVIGATKNGAGGAIVAVTNPQSVTVTYVGGSPAPQWTATADQPWVQITNGTGVGTGSFSVGVSDSANAIGGASSVTATVTVRAPSAGLSTTVGVTLRLIPNGSSASPFGQVDTPVQNATGVQGAIGVTGWALDDVGVASVKIYRNCLPVVDASCQSVNGHSVIYIGDAAFVPGARSDLEGAFATSPQSYRGGWGYLMLTNMLPNVPANLAYGGQGRLTLYAFATDMEGRRTLLGRAWSGDGSGSPTAITMANNTIAKPFGAIDTPGQGQTVSGTIPNFGWVLTPDTNTTADGSDIIVPINGSTMNVVIDGAAVGTVAYNQCRVGANPVTPGTYCLDDVASIFGNPTPRDPGTPRSSNPTLFRNLDAGRAAIGAFDINTTLLSNGRHSIAWGVTDSAGRPEGIGSRDFIVLNGSSRIANKFTVAAIEDAAVTNLGRSSDLTERAISAAPVSGRTGFDFSAPLELVAPEADGVRRVTITEIGRLELWLGEGVTAGYLEANGQLRPLPPGSRLDRDTGRFTWGPLVGYIGPYDLVFLNGDGVIPVRVTLQPKSSVTAGLMRGHIDVPATRATVGGAFVVGGWALDLGAWQGSGVGAVHVWANRVDMPSAPGQFLGAAELGVARPDVAAAFGPQFDRAGWEVTAPRLAPGAYDITAYFWSARTGRFEDARTVSVTVR